MLELRIVPEHSTSMRGLSTDIKCMRLRSRRPQNRTSRRNFDRFGRTSLGTGRIVQIGGGGGADRSATNNAGKLDKTDFAVQLNITSSHFNRYIFWFREAG